MAHSVTISDKFYEEAKRYATLELRSVPMQLMHWAKIAIAVDEKHKIKSHQDLLDVLEKMEDIYQNG
jgi:hypothetical protein